MEPEERPNTFSRLGFHLDLGYGRGGGGSVSDWILANGTWNDDGFWRDDEQWKDS